MCSTLDYCVVINMHWKVLCFCRSHGSLICSVLMYRIYSGLFRWAYLAMCQTYISVHWRSRLRLKVCLIYWKGKQATVVPCMFLLDEVPKLHSSHYTWVWRIPRVGHVFYGNRQCLEFCSPLYIKLKFLRKVLILHFFNNNISFSWSFLTF